MTADSREPFFDLKKYFVSSGDKASKIWTIGNKESPFLLSTVRHSAGDREIAIVDQFDGKQPLIINHKFLVEGRGDVSFVPVAILDSNVANHLHRYRIGDAAFRSSDLGRVIRSLLCTFIKLGCDYNPFFYYLEAFAKNDHEDFHNHALDIAESMLVLHSMDEARFVERDEIKPNPNALEYYLKLHNTKDLREAAGNYLKNNFFGIDRIDVANSVDAIYASLLKIALISETKQSASKKLADFILFCTESLGVMMGREVIVAAYHFSNQAGSFIPLKAGAGWERARRRLLASAWDLYLLRLPEYLLAQGDQDEATLAYVCTGEKLLQDIGQKFVVSQIICQNQNTHNPRVLFEYKLEEIQKRLDNALPEVLKKMQNIELVKFEEEVRQSSLGDISVIIAELEKDARAICKAE